MATSGHTTRRVHPILAAARHITDELKTITDAPTWSLTDQETREALTELTHLTARLAAAQLKVAAHADAVKVGDATGATTSAWLAHATKVTHAEAHRTLKLAQSLDTKHEPVAVALAEGTLCVEQARVIIAAVDALPEDLGTAVADHARSHLITLAADHDAKALRNLGRCILEVAAPDHADEVLAAQLFKEEQAAARKAYLRMWDDGHGTTHGQFALPTWQADFLRIGVHALASPRRPENQTTGARPEGSTPHGLGVAFGEYVTRYPATKLPTAGGLNATIVATMDYETLLQGLKAARLSTGTLISPTLARKLACNAGIIPAVLGGDSEVLDLGRKRRFHSPPQRTAMVVRDGQCTTQGCEVPAAWTDAHHVIPYAKGGKTSVEHGILLCPHHHGLAHHPQYEMHHHPEPKVTFTRRC